MYWQLWRKIKDLFRSTSNSSDNYDGKFMKIRFSSDDDLPLKKTLKLHNIIIVVKPVFHDGNKYSPQNFLDECLHKLV